MNARFRFSAISIFLMSVFLVFVSVTSRAQTNVPIYTDSLQNGWQNYSWATVNLTNSSPVHAGTKSSSVSCGSYQAFYVHQTAFDSTPYTNITFWIYVTASGTPPLHVQGTLGGTAQSASYQIPALTSNTWTQIVVPLSAIGVAGAPNMDGFWIQNNNNATIPTFYMDDITLNTNAAATPGTNATAVITVDAGVNRHPISPLIYGVAFASAAQVADLNVPLNRSGGNEETTYNWQINAHGKGNDYYFESLADASPVVAASADSLISASKSGGAQPMITISMIGWMPKLGPSRGKLASYSVSKYGPQTGTDPYLPDAGNGISVTNNTSITWNDPNDAYFQTTNVLFEQAYVQHFTNRWGMSTNGGVAYYLMDNEHTLWHSTHQDIHPVGTTMQEIYSNMLAYATMVKNLDSNALVLGPEEWGWPGYFYSGYDQQWSGAHNNYNQNQFPDRGTNGGWDYMPWLLNQFHQHDSNSGVRLLDYFTLHCYPQENNVFADAVDYNTQLVRNASTRQFWDTNYVDPSWINSVIMLIPRMRGWANTYYPGTKIGITEYNWGGEPYMGGATAQADVFGIFGRESLDLATRWTTPNSTTPTYLAIKMYRNYDGNKSTFGDTSISAIGPNPDSVATFAATRKSDSALTVMVVSKYPNGGITPVSLAVSNFLNTGVAQSWQLNSSNTIARLGDLTISAGKLNFSVPGQSVTLLVLPAKTFTFQPGPPRSDGKIGFSINGEIGQTFIVQFSTNLTAWQPVSTNTLTGTQTNFLFLENSTKGFYRAMKLP